VTDKKNFVRELGIDIFALANERLKFINENKEKLVEAFIAETGFRPSECQMVINESRAGISIIYMRRFVNEKSQGGVGV